MNLSVKTLLSIVVATSIYSHNASASEGGLYLSGKAGTSFVHVSKQKIIEHDYNNGQVSQYDADSMTNGVFNGGIAFGYDFYPRFNRPIRAELDVMIRDNVISGYDLITSKRYTKNNNSYTTSSLVNNKVSLNTFMVNTYYDFKNNSNVMPYISFGIGMANIKHKTIDNYQWVSGSGTRTGHGSAIKSNTTNNLAWSVGVGAQLAISSQLSLDIGYRYLDAGSSVVTNHSSRGNTKSKLKAGTGDVIFGAVYRF